MPTIPLVDLKAQYAAIQPEIDAAIQRVIDSTAFILGPEVQAFEEHFAAYCDAPFAVGLSSGTDALHLALQAVGVQPGDEVITTPFTFIATAEAISMCGAHPVFVDIDPRTYNIDPARIEQAITPATRAILPVHLYGQTADMAPILDIARRHDLSVIEDAAQAHGACYEGKRAGSLAEAACFSFYPGKNLGAYGDAGMVVTDDAHIADTVRLLSNHGRTEKYEHQVVGYGNRLDALQAAILQVKLSHLDDWNARRRQIAALYSSRLVADGVTLPFVPDWAEPVWHQYVVAVEDRDRIWHHLRDAGIQAGIHYPIPLHLQPAYRHLGHQPSDFPHAEHAAAHVLSLPIYPELSESQVAQIVDVLKTAISTRTHD